MKPIYREHSKCNKNSYHKTGCINSGT